MIVKLELKRCDGTYETLEKCHIVGSKNLLKEYRRIKLQFAQRFYL